MGETARPKWQRARSLRTSVPGYGGPRLKVGDLLWVRCEPPHLATGVSPKGLIFGTEELLHTSIPCDLPPHFCFGVATTDVELLPEFSFADDPDAEVRQ